MASPKLPVVSIAIFSSFISFPVRNMQENYRPAFLLLLFFFGDKICSPVCPGTGSGLELRDPFCLLTLGLKVVWHHAQLKIHFALNHVFMCMGVCPVSLGSCGGERSWSCRGLWVTLDGCWESNSGPERVLHDFNLWASSSWVSQLLFTVVLKVLARSIIREGNKRDTNKEGRHQNIICRW